MRFCAIGLRSVVVAAALGLLMAWGGRLPAAEPAAARDLPRLAMAGQFDRLLADLQADAHLASDSKVAALIKDLQRQQRHSAEAAATRRQAHEKALAKMNDLAGQDKLDEALVSAVEAHGLAEDRAAALKDPRLSGLIARAEAAAGQSEKQGDWLEALNLYRMLDLLFEEAPRYRPQAKQAERRVRLLRMYAPDELRKLFDARMKRMGKDKAEPLVLGGDTWKQQLEGVSMDLLQQTLAYAGRRHVTGTGYAVLTKGALEALLALADTAAVGVSFPGVKDAEKVAAFKRDIAALRKGVDEAKSDYYFLDAAQAIEKARTANANTLGLPDEVMVYEMADGALSTLDDFTNVIWPREVQEFSRNIEGKFFGVGIQISRRDGRLLVVSPLEGTPAQKGGVKAGDIIATVNGQSTAGWSLDQAVRTITGPEGSEVELGVERVGHSDPLAIKLRRAEIIIESIKGWEHKPEGGWSYLIDPTLKIGYVRLTQFIKQSAGDLDAAINQMEAAGGVNALILDLRFNPGGLLPAAVEICDRFIEDGLLVSTVGASGAVTSRASARKDKTYAPFPVVVLINEGSASASEIVSGCLQDYGRATVVGQRSFGKGSVQEVHRLDKGRAMLKLTEQYYRLPKGRIIHREPTSKTWGVQPDLAVRMTDQQAADLIEFRQEVDVLRDPEAPTTQPAPKAEQILEKGLDPQLEAALLVLKTQLVTQHLAVAARTAAPAQAP